MKVLKTQRLVLRKLRDEDAPALAHAANNYEVVKWLNLLPYPYSMDDAKWFIDSIRDTKEEPFGVFYNEQYIGVVGTEGSLGLGYWFAQEFWGRGFGTEAARAAVDLHFSNAEAADLLSGYVVNNFGSARIQEKLGFKVTGRQMVKRKYLEEVEQVKTILTREGWLSL